MLADRMWMAAGRRDAADEFLAFTDSGIVNTTTAEFFTFSDRNLGDPSVGRIILVAIANTNTASGVSGTVTAATAAGVSLAARAGPVTRENISWASIWAGYVPNGATGDVTVTLTSGSGNNELAVFVYRLLFGAVSPHATATASGSNSASTTINVPAGGVLLACSAMALPSSDNPRNRYAAGSNFFDTTQSGLSVGVNMTDTVTFTNAARDGLFSNNTAISATQRTAFAALSWGPS